MIAQSFEITADISKSIREFFIVVRSKIDLFPPSSYNCEKISKSEAEFIMSNKLRCYVQINSVAKPNFK